MNKHSKAPWTVRKSKSRKQPVLFVRNGRAEPIAMVYTNAADAALMAAAPRLLAALKALTKARPHTTPFVEALNRAQALIAELQS